MSMIARTHVVAWGDEQTEHIARRAAEEGDSTIEELCDRVLAGTAPVDLLIAEVSASEPYREWLIAGSRTGWKERFDWVCSDCGSEGRGHHACELPYQGEVESDE